MAQFDHLFNDALAKIREHFKKKDETAILLLAEYAGRTLTLVVNGDATYLFTISEDDVKLSHPAKGMVGNDMRVTFTDTATAKRVLEDRKGGMMDIVRGKIKLYNISSREMQLLREFSGK